MCKCHDQHCHCECGCHGHGHGKHHGGCQCDCDDHACECGCHESAHGHHHGEECACERGEKFERRYATRAERIAQLEAYLKDLKTEIQAVEEHLAELKSAE